MKITIVRLSESLGATIGQMLINGFPAFVTLEPPWLDNQKNISCIPPGVYECEAVESPKFGPTWEVKNVINRKHILIHQLNFVNETQGCIGIGTNFARASIGPMITSSGQAFKEFTKRMNGAKTFQLTITKTAE